MYAVTEVDSTVLVCTTVSYLEAESEAQYASETDPDGEYLVYLVSDEPQHPLAWFRAGRRVDAC